MKVAFKNKRGSLLIFALILFSVIMILALAFVGQELLSKRSAIRSQMAAEQEITFENTLQRFCDTFASKSESGKTLPTPQPSQAVSDPDYDIPFSCNSDIIPGFKVGGRWKKDDSIYYAPQDNPGEDFTDIPQWGYYDEITAEGYDKTKVAPAHNFVTLNSPLKSRYAASFTYHFPYGAFAPEGMIFLKDAYGCSNPLDDENKNGDYYSGIPVDMMAKIMIRVDEYPYGKAYSQMGFIFNKSIKGVLKFTHISKTQKKEAENYVDILTGQLKDLYDKMEKASLNKEKVILGKNVLSVSKYIKNPTEDDIITLQQAAEFPFSGMTVNEKNPSEKTMGDYYIFTVHDPNPPDIREMPCDTDKTMSSTKKCYKLLDRVQGYFERYNITWRKTPTEICLIQAEASLLKDICWTTDDLRKAIEKSNIPIIGWYYRYKAIKLAIKLGKLLADEVYLYEFVNAFIHIRIDEGRLIGQILGKAKAIPETVEEDKAYDNSGWPFIKVCKVYSLPVIAEQLNQAGNEKYADLGTDIAFLDGPRIPISHFGKKPFKDTWKRISPFWFTYQGTLVIPRGRSLHFPHSMTIKGDLWLQDGATLFVGGKLKVEPPKEKSKLPELVKPTGRVFLGEGASIVVKKEFECKGTLKLGSVVLTSPYKKIDAITSAIYSKKGNVIIPYGIVPGISMDELAGADGSPLPPNMQKGLKSIINEAANISKICGAFHIRRSYFSKNPATFVVFRHKELGFFWDPLNLPIVMPLKVVDTNILNLVFPVYSQSFTYVLNAYLGEHTFTHSDWWVFGDGVVPVLPKMDVENTSQSMSKLTGTESTIQKLDNLRGNIDNILLTDQPLQLIATAQDLSRQTFSVYKAFYDKQFSELSIEPAIAKAVKFKNSANKAYKPFADILTKMSALESSILSSNFLFTSFYDKVYDDIKSQLPGGKEQRTYLGCPGVLVYAGGSIKMGTGGSIPDGTIMPASGLFIADKRIEIKGPFRVVGCLISLKRSIYGFKTQLRFYPYFTRASIYMPKDLKGDLDKNLQLVSDDDLKSNTDPCNVGITMPRVFSRGWEFYSEFYKD